MNIMVVDDSALIRAIVKEVLVENGNAIVGEAGNGKRAVAMAAEIRPDLIIMDYNMPLMNGLEATRAIMADVPTPIIIFSNAVDGALSYEALQAGAAEVLAKPEIDKFNDSTFLDAFLTTLRAAAQNKHRYPSGTNGMRREKKPDQSGNGGGAKNGIHPFQAVVIGASTGGPAALRQLLHPLPRDFPVGIAVVQHIEPRFAEGFAAWLNSSCSLRVRVAKQNDLFTPGEVVVAPGDFHLVCTAHRLTIEDGPKVGNHKPAVDKLFTTTAQCYGSNTLGILLTGMGADGAAGCVAIRNAGGTTLVQDERTSFIYGMPKAAAERGGASHVLPLDRIAPTLMEAARHHG